ncbi:MAG TPA: hypothetical protein VNO43_01035, partial [Candidatus Eisenbacteria bacterium]|nr:hypothetical protein [Candidatus Eisenbacteria bacterium]
MKRQQPAVLVGHDRAVRGMEIGESGGLHIATTMVENLCAFDWASFARDIPIVLDYGEPRG